jgi:hypothetical protein
MMMCPWCLIWEPLENYTMLQSPPNHSDQTAPIYKHGGQRGCKKLFSLAELA